MRPSRVFGVIFAAALLLSCAALFCGISLLGLAVIDGGAPHVWPTPVLRK